MQRRTTVPGILEGSPEKLGNRQAWPFILAVSVLAVTIAACGDAETDSGGTHDDRPASQQQTHPRARSGYTEVRSEPLEVGQQISPEDDAIYAPYIQARVSTLGTVETIRIEGEDRRPAKGERFYVAQVEVVPDRYDARMAKESNGSGLEQFPYVAARTTRGEEQLDLDPLAESMNEGSPEPESYTIIAAGNEQRPPELFVGDYNRTWHQTLDLTRGKLEKGSVRAVEPVTVDLSETYNESATADLRTSSEATITHVGKLHTARISSFDTREVYAPKKNIVTVDATLRFDITGFSSTQIAYYPARSAVLFDNAGNSYPGLLEGTDAEQIQEFGERRMAAFQFTVPSGARAFTLEYRPDTTLVGADGPKFPRKRIPIDFGSD